MPFKLFLAILNHVSEWSCYQMVDGRGATGSCSLSVPLPRLARVSARSMSSKSWSASTGTSTPWLGLVSILLRRVAQAGTRSLDSASLCIISRSSVSVRLSFEHRYSTQAFE